MWYIEQNLRFFLVNVIMTVIVLTGLTFATPPFINWLIRKIQGDEDSK